MNTNSGKLDLLEKHNLIVVMKFMKNTLKVCSEKGFHKLILDFAQYFGYEYVLYGYMKACYNRSIEPCVINLSNPKEWAKEYDEHGYYSSDPVVLEVDHRLNNKIVDNYILWDSYDRPLNYEEQTVIQRRKHYGLQTGFSIFENSLDKNFVFLLSFGTSGASNPEYMPGVMNNVISHLTSARKRLDILHLINSLTKREYAVAEQLTLGQANYEIAYELKISEATVKFHLTNIYKKLGVGSRQETISLLLVARYLCIT